VRHMCGPCGFRTCTCDVAAPATPPDGRPPLCCITTAARTEAVTEQHPPLQAFVAEYEKFPMFSSGEGRRRIANLDEFDECREEVASLSAAYKSLESTTEPT
jgi:hypothetical protein